VLDMLRMVGWRLATVGMTIVIGWCWLMWAIRDWLR
jgi:hypothetical protein